MARHAEGARGKFTVRSPEQSQFDFIRPQFRYMFKESDERYPYQYWGESFAYRFGALVGVSVPPTYVALDSGKAGALSEWFYGDGHVHIAGGDLLLGRDPKYDRQKGFAVGHAHALNSVLDVLTEHQVVGFKEDLARMLTFDTLIANSDRHHDNWGIVGRVAYLKNPTGLIPTTFTMTPAFDNGTSLGNERHEKDLHKCLQDSWLKKHTYGSKARHHMRINADDAERASGRELLAFLVEESPDLISVIAKTCQFSICNVEVILGELQKFDVPFPLSPQRSELISRIIAYRQRMLHEWMNSDD